MLGRYTSKVRCMVKEVTGANGRHTRSTDIEGNGKSFISEYSKHPKGCVVRACRRCSGYNLERLATFTRPLLKLYLDQQGY